jgi:hypothetical protein
MDSPGRRSLPPTPADELRAAFGMYASAVGWRWKVRIRALHVSEVAAPGSGPDPAVVRIDLSRADARVLTELLRAAADPAGELGPRGPIGSWIGTGEAARRIGMEASTIRGWITRHGPKGHPFPAPEVRYGGRNYWQKTAIDRWTAEQRRLDRQHRAASSRPQS